MRAPRQKRGRQAAPATLCARFAAHVALETRADGELAAAFHGYALGLGPLSAAAAARVRRLRTGLPLRALQSRSADADKQVQALLRKLAARGLLEYGLGRKGEDAVVIEPQTPDYWPKAAPLAATDVLALSRFVYLRRRASELVVESPLAKALLRIRDPAIAVVLARLAVPQQVKHLRRQRDFPGPALLGLLVDCRMLFKLDAAAAESGLRMAEGDDALVLWDFHDLLFHARSTEGRHANPIGGVYPYADAIASPPAERPSWPGEKIGLDKIFDPNSQAPAPAAKLLRARRSTRDFDPEHPIALGDLAQFLDGAARILARFETPGGEQAPPQVHTMRPYPSGGASYELELYLAVDRCEGLARGFYHYDAGRHALAAIEVAAAVLDAHLQGAARAMGTSSLPQILITVAARFGRVSWKYSSLAYALILKDAGALLQTFYLMATDLGLGGCAIGSTDIGLFGRMTGIEFHVEGPVGQFALGRAPASGTPAAAPD